MRKQIAILLTLILTLSLCACTSDKKEQENRIPASEMELPEATDSDLTQAEIEQILAEMEAAEAGEATAQ